MNRFVVLTGLATVATLSLFVPASAQIPTDAPRGTICVTPVNWCRVPAGPPGAPCSCKAPDGGWVQGTLR